MRWMSPVPWPISSRLGVRVHCLALGGVDLTSSTGKLTMGVINAVAQFERDLLIERTQAGLRRARAEGKIDWSAREPHTVTIALRSRAASAIGESVSALGKAFSNEPADDHAGARWQRAAQSETGLSTSFNR